MRRARAVDANHQSWLAFSGFTRVDLSSLQRRRPSPVQYVIYPITGTAACCARAASGHAAATTQNSVMNSRRLMGAHPKAKDRKISIAGQDRASQQKRTVHVRFGSFATMAVEATASRKSASLPKADKWRIVSLCPLSAQSGCERPQQNSRGPRPHGDSTNSSTAEKGKPIMSAMPSIPTELSVTTKRREVPTVFGSDRDR
jgi:hypothetical protein